MRTIDLRCDALSTQTAEMLDAVNSITPGDDVFYEDSSTRDLENYAKTLCEMEDALFVPSGTMGNLLAVLSHVNRGGEIILGRNSHINNLEVSGAAALGGISYRSVDEKNGVLNIEELEASIREDDIYSPPTKLICLENTHNLEGGIAILPDTVADIGLMSKKHDLPVHLDGARIFNACALLDVAVSEYTKHVDSIMFCLAKGIGAPVGAILAGNGKLIKRARKYRKMIGGGMRQPGYLTAMGLIALRNNLDQLSLDNKRARTIANRISKLDVFNVVKSDSMTNIVYAWLKDEKTNALDYLPELEKNGIKMLANKRGFRAVLYHDIDDDDVDRFCHIMETIFG